jgi:hypothetical protein
MQMFCQLNGWHILAMNGQLAITPLTEGIHHSKCINFEGKVSGLGDEIATCP